MKTGMDTAKCYLHCCGYSLVVARGECVEIVSRERGLMPLLMVYDKSSSTLDGASLADKVIGKAAAFILAETGIAEVWADVMSREAIPVLEKKGIRYAYRDLVPRIMNRTGEDICPMEKICRDIEDPLEGIMAITAFICRSRCSAEHDADAEEGNCTRKTNTRSPGNRSN